MVAGSLFNYGIALALARELDRFPGGPVAFARSMRPGTEALRLMRWPADRLDTLGGYLTYHNLTLYTFVLTVYAAVQGALAVRGAEDRHAMELVLATGRSRPVVLRDLAAGFAATLLVISLGLGLGVAVAMAAAGQPDLTGSVVALLVSGTCALVGYGLGVLVSQVLAARAAAGVSALILTVLYVGTNVADEIGPLGAVRYLSPFHYADASRVLVPGVRFDAAATAALLLLSALLLGAATWAFRRRDCGSSLWPHRVGAPRAPRSLRVQRRMLRSVWTERLLRGRLSILVWATGAGAFLGVLALLEPTVMDVWSVYASLFSFTGAGPGVPPETQYMALAGELLTPVVAAYVVTQVSGWVDDLVQGRVEMVLAAPVSWSRLVVERLLALAVGVAAITAGALVGLGLGALPVDAPLDPAGVGRLVGGAVLLGAALGAVGAVAVAVFRRGAVAALAVFVAVSYLLGVLVPSFGWPTWIGRLSVFTAFGHPYLDWPPWGGVLVLVLLAVGGAALGAAVAERTPKVAH